MATLFLYKSYKKIASSDGSQFISCGVLRATIVLKIKRKQHQQPCFDYTDAVTTEYTGMSSYQETFKKFLECYTKKAETPKPTSDCYITKIETPKSTSDCYITKIEPPKQRRRTYQKLGAIRLEHRGSRTESRTIQSIEQKSKSVSVSKVVIKGPSKSQPGARQDKETQTQQRTTTATTGECAVDL